MTRPTSPSPRPAARLRPHAVRFVALAAAAALVLSGCATTATTAPAVESDQTAASTVECTTAALPETRIEIAALPAGPTSACITETGLHSPAPTTPSLPVTVTDAQGTEVTVTSADRILPLDLSGTISSTVFALGLGDRVVGRDTATAFPEASALPLVTQHGHQLNGEAILGLDPTVILTDTSLGPWDVILQMREAGIPVVVLPANRSIGSMGEFITDVADALGVPEAGAALAATAESAVDASAARIDAILPDSPGERLRMMFLYVRGSANVYYVFGEESGADELIHALGGVDAAADAGITGMRPLTAEAIVTAAPDVVLVMTHGLESVGGVDGLLEKVPALAQTPAGEQRRIIDVPDHEILSFGPDYSAVLDGVGAAIYAPGDAR